jgi:TBC1 domain family member 15
VNELSNTIDLHTTLVQAEALFRRFHRTVEAIDRKHAFPPPSGAQLRQRKPDVAQGTAKLDAADAARVAVAVDAAPGATSSGNDARGGDAPGGATVVQQVGEEEAQDGAGVAGTSAAAKGKGPALPDMVSPELRALLDRERPKTAAVAEVVAGKAVQKDGDAV